tara:strand:- start:101 stop:286 length:186 start_codon:yes stop_codon:yes gene_type:complete
VNIVYVSILPTQETSDVLFVALFSNLYGLNMKKSSPTLSNGIAFLAISHYWLKQMDYEEAL